MGEFPMLPVLRSAFCQLKRSPGFAMTAICILAIGIGVTTAMYSVLYSVVLQPLPFPHPRQLVAISAKPIDFLSLPTVQDWKHRTQAFQSIAAYDGWSPRVESSAGVGGADAILVSQNFLGTLGAGFALGHDFAQTGREGDCFHQAIVSNKYWRRIGGGASLAGRTLLLDRHIYAITGVLSAGSALEGADALADPAVLTPIGCDPQKKPEERGDVAFQAIGRLRPDVSLQEAGAQLVTAQKSLTRDFPRYYGAAFTPAVVSLTDSMAGVGTRAALLAAMAACGTLLLISCANLTNLLLARNMKRRAEFALRATLGAMPRHLLSQMFAESCALAVLGALAGLGIAEALVRAVSAITIVHLPRLAQVRVNLPVLLFAALATGAVALLLTVLPAQRALRPGLLADLSSGAGRSTSASRGLRRVGHFLVAVQIAMALVLVAGAGWMVSSVLILLYQPLGFDPGHLVIASARLGDSSQGSQPATPAKTLADLDQALMNLRAIPGVAAVAAANDKPLGGRINRYSFCADIHPDACRESSFQAPDVFQVTPGYFQTIGQDLYRGRAFTASDDDGNHVAIVNRALAAQQWPGQNPVGHRIYSDAIHAWAVVVGEVGSVHSYSLEDAPRPNLYLPEADGPDTSITFMVRTQGDPNLLDEPVRRTLRKDESLSVRSVESMPELMGHRVALRRFSMWGAAVFGCLALSLSILGTYGLLAYEVSLREREIGIRLALGSSRPAIVALMMRKESVWIAGGILSGLAGAAMTGYLLRAEFFHTGAASVPVLTVSALLLALSALAAVILPSRRASLLDPAITLRSE
jgi:predicted permease